MITQRTNLANLVTTIHSGHVGETGTPSLADSFQAYVTDGQAQRSKDTSEHAVTNNKRPMETNHKEAYEKEKISTESYSAQQERVQDKADVNQSDGMSDEQLEQLEESIRDVLKEALDMTDVEIDEILATEGLTIFSLLQPEQLQEFLMAATETEPMDLLTDSSLNDVFQAMNTEMQGFIQEFEVDDAQMNQWMNQDVAVPEQISATITEKDVFDEPAESTEPLQADDSEWLDADDSDAGNETKNRTDVESNTAEAFTTKDSESGIQVHVQGVKKQDVKGQTQQGFATEIVNQLTQAVDELQEVQTSFSSNVQQSEIVRQVIEQIRVNLGNDLNQLEVQLYPQHLGRVQIQVMMKNGVMTAQIHAETEMAKEAIESQLQQLKETFQEKNLQVEAVEVSVGTSNFQNEQERQDSAKNSESNRAKGRKIQLDEFGMPFDDTETDESTSERLEAQGASVEFSA